MSPEERYKFEFLATLVHEACLQTLADWLRDAPPWAERFVAELVHDGFVAIRIGRHSQEWDQEKRLSVMEAEELLASDSSRTAGDVWLLPTPEGARQFDESNSRAMFEYCEHSRAHFA